MNEDPLVPSRGCFFGFLFSAVIVAGLVLVALVLAFILE
jgi:hypothetical protein